MITNTARVLAINNGNASLAPTSQSGCGACQQSSACAISGLGKYISFNRKPVVLPCDATVQPGDELQLSMSESDFLKTGMLVYLLPTVLTLLGAGLAASLGLDDVGGFDDVGAVIGAGSGFFGGLLLVRLIAWQPQISIQQNEFEINQGDRA